MTTRQPREQRLVRKMNLYFVFEIRNCLDLLSAPIGLSVQFHTKNKPLLFAYSPKDLKLSCCCFAEDGLEIYKDL